MPKKLLRFRMQMLMKLCCQLLMYLPLRCWLPQSCLLRRMKPQMYCSGCCFRTR